jgi:septum site-determining protein MinD
MSKIISVHSYRGGTGKSNTTANLASIIARGGNRVAIVDTDIQSPGIHVLFGFSESTMDRCLNDYLWGRCPIGDTAYNVSSLLPKLASNGTLYLIPSSIKAGEIARVLREGYDVGLLTDGFQELIDVLDLDYLFIDTHPGAQRRNPPQHHHFRHPAADSASGSARFSGNGCHGRCGPKIRSSQDFDDDQ